MTKLEIEKIVYASTIRAGRLDPNEEVLRLEALVDLLKKIATDAYTEGARYGKTSLSTNMGSSMREKRLKYIKELLDNFTL